jgi:Ca2+-binding RTX toxin-like protein
VIWVSGQPERRAARELPELANQSPQSLAPPTAQALNTITGTSDDDTLLGTAGDDIIFGLDGNDRVFAAGGNDVVEGGLGNDRLQGEAGDDILRGGDGDDILSDINGTDQLFGGAGNDRLQNALGADQLDGGDGNDEIAILSGGRGSIALGGSGDDLIYSNTFESAASGGAGRDRFQYWGLLPANTASLNTNVITDFDSGPFGDILDVPFMLSPLLSSPSDDPFALGFLRFRQSGANVFVELDRDGSAGAVEGFHIIVTLQNNFLRDMTAEHFGGLDPAAGIYPFGPINGSSGPDTLIGSDDLDVINGLAGPDWLYGLSGDNTLNGGDGEDHLRGGLGDDLLIGGADRDMIIDDGGVNRIDAGAGSDIIELSGAQGGSRIDAGAGDDSIRINISFATVTTGSGVDEIFFGAPATVLGSGPVGLDITDFAAGANGDQLTLNLQPLIGYRRGDPLWRRIFTPAPERT